MGRALLLGFFRCAPWDSSISSFDPRRDDALHLIVNRHHAQQHNQRSSTHHALPNDGFVEIPVLLAAGSKFRQNKVVDADAKPGRAARVGIADANQKLLPSRGKNSRLR